MRKIWSVAILLAVSAHASFAQDRQSAYVLPAATLVQNTELVLGPKAAKSEPKPTDAVTIVIGGDLGFASSALAPSALGARRHGAIIPFETLTEHLRPLIAGDVVFANLETVVTERADLTPVDKSFNFRSHPAGVRHLVGLGLNAISTANNHAVDYGAAGMAETLRHLEMLRSAGGLQAFPGIGRGRQAALAPHTVIAKGVAVNISAIGIGAGTLGVRDTGTRPAMAFYGSSTDLAETTAALAASGGDVRVLSVHYGTEMQVRPSSADEQRLRAAADSADAHIVAGHHAHVAAGVQQSGGRFVFYGLGNLLHPGMQDMSRHGICRDYGLLARVHLRRMGARFEIRAIEAVPLVDMHASVRARSGDDGRLRIAVVNHLAAGLDRPGGTTGVRFMPREDGTGLWCAAGADEDGGRSGDLCRGYEVPAPPPLELARRIAASCGAEIAARSSPATPQQASVKTVRISPQPAAQDRDWRDVVLRDASGLQ